MTYLDDLQAVYDDYKVRNFERDYRVVYSGKGDGSTTFVNPNGTARREVYYYEKKNGVAMPYGVAILADKCPIPYEDNANNVDKPVILGRRPGSTQDYIIGVSVDAEGMTSPAGKTPLDLRTSGAGTGTVTSVGLSLPAIITVSGSPVTTTGTLTGTLANQTANTVFAGPTSGGAAAPTFRVLVAGDIPSGTGTIDLTGTAGEALSANDAVYLNASDNKWYKLDIDATATVKVGFLRGFATASISSSASGTIRVLGILTGFSSLTAGALVYGTTTAGSYTQTRPTLTGGGGQRTLVPLGFAASTTSVNIWPYPVQFQIRNSVASGGTLTVEHYTDAAARMRKLFAYTSITTGGTLTSYSSANQDDGAILRGGAGATTTITASGATFGFGNISGSDYWSAQSFQVTAGHISQITVTMGTNGGTPAGTATWEIRSDSAGNPGTVIDSGTFTPTASSTNTIPVSGGIYLSASTTYWLVLHTTSAQSSNNYWTWQGVSSGSVYASGNAQQSSNGGSTYTNYPNADLQMSVTTVIYDRIAQSFQIGSTATVDYVALYLKKVGAPAGTMTLRVETNSGSAPSGTLADANATITVAESALSTSYSNVTFNFTDFSLTGSTTYWLVLSTSRASDASNYVVWGVDASSPSYTNGNLSTYTSAAYTADTSRDAIFDVEGPTTTYESELDIDYWSSSQAVILNRYDDGAGANGDIKTTVKNNQAGTVDLTVVVELP